MLKSQAGLTCDACGFWHHTACEDVSDEVYEFLCDHSDDASLAWYSNKCAAVSKKLTETTVSVHDQQQQVVRVEQLKADVCRKMEQMNRELRELRNMMNNGLDKPDTRDGIVAVKEQVTKLVEKQRTDNHELRNCVQVREKLQEDKEEIKDIKRSTNIIIHGLKVTKDDTDARTRAEEDQIEDMLHAIWCNDVSVQNMVRLGRHDSMQQTLRTVTVALASEQQRDKVLSQAKKLAWQQCVRESVYTAGLDSQAEAEKTEVCGAAKAEEGRWRIELDNNSRQQQH